MIFELIIILFIILSIYKTIEQSKFNINGTLINVENNIELNKNLKNLNPVIYNIQNELSFEDLISKKPGYYINHDPDIFLLSGYKNEEYFNVYKNRKIVDSFELTPYFFDLKILKDYNYLISKKYSVSLLKGNIIVPIKKSLHNYNIIGNIEGETVIYLINPKHSEEIINKNENELKKWSHKLHLKKDDVLFIPTGWFYFQEVNTEIFQYEIELDSIYTFIPHFFKNLKN